MRSTARVSTHRKRWGTRAEDGDNLQGLYEQMGLTAEEFAAQQGIEDMSSFTVEAGATSFDITSNVVSNTDFDGNSTSSNCHGFVAQATGGTVSEGQRSGTNTTNMTQTNAPTTGDVAVFNMQGSYQYKGQPPVAASGVQAHAAIFIVNNQAGQPQYLNRINTGQPVSVSTQSQIVNFFSNPNNAYGGASAYNILPKLNPNPSFFKH